MSVFEASRSGGGRARAVPLPLPDGREVMADNGQHILIGAYSETLRLMRLVGAEPQRLLLRLPLALAYPDGTGLALPAARWLPAPLDAAWFPRINSAISGFFFCGMIDEPVEKLSFSDEANQRRVGGGLLVNLRSS